MTWQKRVFLEFEKFAVGALVLVLAAIVIVLFVAALDHPIYFTAFIAGVVAYWLGNVLLD